MDIELLLCGVDATDETTVALQDWLRREQVVGLRVERMIAPPVEGEMGIDPLTALSIVLGSQAVVELMKSVHVWIKTRRPKLTIKLKTVHEELEIDAENLPELQALIEKVLAMMKSTRCQENSR